MHPPVYSADIHGGPTGVDYASTSSGPKGTQGPSSQSLSIWRMPPTQVNQDPHELSKGSEGTTEE